MRKLLTINLIGGEQTLVLVSSSPTLFICLTLRLEDAANANESKRKQMKGSEIDTWQVGEKHKTSDENGIQLARDRSDFQFFNSVSLWRLLIA